MSAFHRVTSGYDNMLEMTKESWRRGARSGRRDKEVGGKGVLAYIGDTFLNKRSQLLNEINK